MASRKYSTGVLIKPPSKSDWIAGGETGIAFKDNMPSLDWTPYLPSFERQFNYRFDTMACVSYSSLNSVETSLNFLLRNGKIPNEKLQILEDLGYLVNGEPNFSDRALAKMSGTTSTGNYLPNVWDSIRNHGLLPEKDWPFPENYSWEEYYAEIPEELKAKALEFKKIFDVKYEYVVTEPKNASEIIALHLRQAPIQIVSPICRPWNEMVFPCGSTSPDHATMACKLNPTLSVGILDHYEPFQKSLAWRYYIPYAIKGVIELRESVPVAPFYYEFAKDMRRGERSEEVKMLQKALKVLGFFSLQETGYYWNQTQEAVFKFQLKYVNLNLYEKNVLKGSSVGPKTREALKVALKKSNE